MATGHMSFLYHLVSVYLLSVINFSHILISCKTIQLKPNLTGIILRKMRGNMLLSKFHIACNGQFMKKIIFLRISSVKEQFKLLNHYFDTQI